MNDKKIKVTVTYTGHDDYQSDVSQGVPVGTVKQKALHEFGIEESAADKYVLQFASANLDDHTKIGDLGQHEVTLMLLLKKPQEKGSGG